MAHMAIRSSSWNGTPAASTLAYGFKGGVGCCERGVQRTALLVRRYRHRKRINVASFLAERRVRLWLGRWIARGSRWRFALPLGSTVGAGQEQAKQEQPRFEHPGHGALNVRTILVAPIVVRHVWVGEGSSEPRAGTENEVY